MGIGRLLTRPVVLHHQQEGALDEYGNPTVTWMTEDTVAYVEQTTTEERVVGREVQSADWLVVLPAGTALDPEDRVEVPDVPAMFEIVGHPSRPRRPAANTESHVEARMRIHTGG